MVTVRIKDIRVRFLHEVFGGQKKIAIIIDNFIDSFVGVSQGVSLSLITID